MDRARLTKVEVSGSIPDEGSLSNKNQSHSLCHSPIFNSVCNIMISLFSKSTKKMGHIKNMGRSDKFAKKI